MQKLLSIIGGFILLWSCSNDAVVEETSNETTDSTKIVRLDSSQQRFAGIRVGKAEVRTINQSLRLNGTIDVMPQGFVSVAFPLGGYIRSLQLLPGMQVKKGQVLATIEDQTLIQLQQEYLLALARSEYTRTDLERQLTLNQSKASSDKTLQQARADDQVQRVLIRSLHEKLQLVGINPSNLNESNISRSVSLRSPITGFVSKVNVNAGRYVQPTEVLFELFAPENVHAELTVFEKDLNNIAQGQTVYVNLADDPAKKYEAKVYLITKDVNDERAGTVYCRFTRVPQLIKPGMYVNAIVHLGGRSTMSVPEEALVQIGDRHYVFVSNGGGEFRLQQVQAGDSFNNYVELISPPAILKNTDIIVDNAYSALMKLKNVSEE